MGVDSYCLAMVRVLEGVAWTGVWAGALPEP